MPLFSIECGTTNISFDLHHLPADRQIDLALEFGDRVRNEEKAAKAIADAQANQRFGVVFVEHGPSKIECIKEIRHQLGWSLKDAKDASEKERHVIATFDEARKAEHLAEALRKTGASAHIEALAA